MDLVSSFISKIFFLNRGIFFLSFFLFIICLAALGHSCSVWNHRSFVVATGSFGQAGPPAGGVSVIATGPPGKSWRHFLF